MIEGKYDSWQVVAGADLTGNGTLHKALTVGGTIAADITQVGGILKSKGNTGELVRVAYQGIVKAYAGAAVNTLGNPITVTTSGFLIAGTSTLPFLGRALATAASGDLFPVMISPA